MKYIYALLFTTFLWGCNKPPEVDPDPSLTLLVFPNPGGKRIWIYVKNDARSQFSLKVFDPASKIVAEWNVPEGDQTNGFDVDPTTVGTGAFHAVLHKDGSVYTKKFLLL